METDNEDLAARGNTRSAQYLIASAAKQELRHEISGMVGVVPHRDKISRMAAVSAKFEAGEVYLPVKAAWSPDPEAELLSFAYGRNDDQCDSISQALNDRSNRMFRFSTRRSTLSNATR
jgi:predicted phage terminase large subunit-like protein